MNMQGHMLPRARIINVILLIFFIIWLSVSAYAGVSLNGGQSISLMSLLSLAFFSSLVLLGVVKERWYWLIAPLVILFTPNAINDMFPGLMMSEAEGTPEFSLFTHIDLFLLLGVVRYCDFSRSLSLRAALIGGGVFFLFLSVILGALINQSFWLTVMGGFQIRYLLLVYLLFVFSNPTLYQREISFSILLAVLMVLLESLIFTYVSRSERLTSGNYGVNSLGHLFAMASVFLVCGCFSRISYVVKFFLFLLFSLAIIGTGTRFSLLVIVISCAFLIFLRHGNIRYAILSVIVLMVCGTVFFNYVPAGISMLDGMELVSENYSDPSSILVTPESSSMITRLILWLGTFDMIKEHPGLGVSPGNWAFHKQQYFIPFEDILDPHQDLLNYLSSYGVLPGAYFYFLIFFLPILLMLRSKFRLDSNWFWVSVVVTFSVAGLSNAVSWKHQISAIAYISSFMIFFSVERKNV